MAQTIYAWIGRLALLVLALFLGYAWGRGILADKRIEPVYTFQGDEASQMRFRVVCIYRRWGSGDVVQAYWGDVTWGGLTADKALLEAEPDASVVDAAPFDRLEDRDPTFPGLNVRHEINTSQSCPWFLEANLRFWHRSDWPTEIKRRLKATDAE